jgi:hypothetical protein
VVEAQGFVYSSGALTTMFGDFNLYDCYKTGFSLYDCYKTFHQLNK